VVHDFGVLEGLRLDPVDYGEVNPILGGDRAGKEQDEQ